MRKLKVVITDYEFIDINQELEIITNAGFELLDYQVKSEDDVITVTKDADAIITQYSVISRKVIDQLNHCKIIIKYGIGINNIDCDAASERGIFVCNVPDYGIDEVSNHAITLMLSLARKLSIITKVLKNGDWGYSRAIPVFRFAGSTLGLVGLGRIATMVAKKLSGFDMNILAFDPLVKADIAQKTGVTLVGFEKLCKESDFISIHCPLIDSTMHLVGKTAFRNMKKTAYIINTARGSVICEKDLIEALEQGEIAGAGIDVFEEEPVKPDNKLLHMDNVIVTPHYAWYSEQAIKTVQRKVAEEVVNVLQGNDPFNLYNKV